MQSEETVSPDEKLDERTILKNSIDYFRSYRQMQQATLKKLKNNQDVSKSELEKLNVCLICENKFDITEALIRNVCLHCGKKIHDEYKQYISGKFPKIVELIRRNDNDYLSSYH